MRKMYNDLHHLAFELSASFQRTEDPPLLMVEDNKPDHVIEASLPRIAKGLEMVLQRLKIIEQEKMDSLVNYNIQLEDRKVPWFFYFVQVQDNYSKKLVMKIFPGMTALRLHMLCVNYGKKCKSWMTKLDVN